MGEDELKRILSCDLSAGTEAFRDTLLAHCLEILRENDGVLELVDNELELLAAAGDLEAVYGMP